MHRMRWIVAGVIGSGLVAGCGATAAPAPVVSSSPPASPVQPAFADPQVTRSSPDVATAVGYDGVHWVVLQIGPLGPMLTKSEAKTAKHGDVMLGGTMLMTQEGHPVNHHLEIHLFTNTGQVVTTIKPSVAISAGAGAVALVVPMVPMQSVRLGRVDFHYGNNVYLAAGDYAVTVTEESHTLTFSHVAVTAASPSMSMPMSSMSSMSSMPSSTNAPPY